jgi:TonB family protein
MGIGDATEFSNVPVERVSRAPKIRKRPILHVPEKVRLEGIEGVVVLHLSISTEGSVTAAVVVQSLHPDADIACIVDIKRTKWKPAKKDGKKVSVIGVPFTCRYENTMEKQ